MGASSGDVQKERARLIDFARVMMMMCARVTNTSSRCNYFFFSSVFDFPKREEKQKKILTEKWKKRAALFSLRSLVFSPKAHFIKTQTTNKT
jgi:hypothetical protein